mmetsp:Transcript_14273/g.21982  ORF Transcript_14273/g.21982 Transcript_14273/m.21982 type:complete len:128 (-) Transcript_14273:120-503(-)
MSDCVPVGEEEQFIEEADSLISTFSTWGKASDQVATSKLSEEQRKTAKNHFNNFLKSPEVRADDMLSKLPVNLDEITVEDMADHNTIQSPTALFHSRVAVFLHLDPFKAPLCMFWCVFDFIPSHGSR